MDHLLNTKEAAQVLNVSEMSIRRWTNSGKLNCYRVGGKRERRFRVSDLEEFLHNSHNHAVKPLGLGGHKVPDGSHMTHFYADDSEWLDVAIPYLVKGIERDEASLAVMPPDKGRQLVADMKDQGHPVGDWLDAGQLRISAGMDSPEEMVRYLVAFAQGAGKFRVLGDMIWTVRRGWDLAALSVLEQVPKLMPPVENGLLLCQYSLEDFSGAAIMMAAESHRQTIYKGRLEKSPYYADPS
ncbi:MAG: MEDS domain-containing protein [Deltaproteobacteria bacterium]|nr:MEDS domain-containing protein [Deltaproteobacteria bacterium]